jgi:hypothetical protein
MTLQQEQDKLIEAGFIKYRLYIIFASITALVICFYGLDEDSAKQERFFVEGDYYNDYQIRVGSHHYHVGIMVSHWANIAVLSIIAIMITWIIHTGLEEYVKKK